MVSPQTEDELLNTFHYMESLYIGNSPTSPPCTYLFRQYLQFLLQPVGSVPLAAAFVGINLHFKRADLEG